MSPSSSPLARYVREYSGWVALEALPLLIVAAVATGGGSWATWMIKEREIARIQLEQAQRASDDERRAREALQAAQARGDELTHQLLEANRQAEQLQEQLDEALRRSTTGRPCLGEPALRLLDRAPGIAPALPATARRAAAADVADLAADPPAGGAGGRAYASDTDVALWARDAAGQYAECVRRLDALIDFEGRK